MPNGMHRYFVMVQPVGTPAPVPMREQLWVRKRLALAEARAWLCTQPAGATAEVWRDDPGQYCKLMHALLKTQKGVERAFI